MERGRREAAKGAECHATQKFSILVGNVQIYEAHGKSVLKRSLLGNSLTSGSVSDIIDSDKTNKQTKRRKKKKQRREIRKKS